jgi:hypothetical protein
MSTPADPAAMHPAAAGHLPFFVTAPGGTDVLLIGMVLFMILAVIGVGVFYLKLHALPEHMAHRGQKVQYEIVAVLALLALFTHNHAFWIAGLFLALLPIPDFITPVTSMAQSLGRLADQAAAQPPSAGRAAPAEGAPPPGPGGTAGLPPSSPSAEA